MEMINDKVDSEVLAMPIEVLNPTSRIRRKLEKLGIRTIDDLLSLHPDEFRKLRGVGRKNLKILVDLQAEARRYAGIEKEETRDEILRAITTTPTDDVLLEELEYAIASRILRRAAKKGIYTLGELRRVYLSGELLKWYGVGEQSVQNLGAFLQVALEEGISAVPTALNEDEDLPATIAEFSDHLMEYCDERTQRILRGRLEEGVTLQALGDEFGLSRERIRQIEAKAIADLQERFGSFSSALCADLIKALNQSRGLLYLEEMKIEAGNSPGAVLLCLLVAGAEDSQIWRGFVTNLKTDEREELLQELKEALIALDVICTDLDEVMKAATALGLKLKEAGLKRLLREAYGINSTSKGFPIPWLRMSKIIASIVHSMGRAADTEEILAAYEELRSRNPGEFPESEKRHIRSYIDLNEEIYGYAHGVYIHVANLPISLEELESAVEWAKKYLKGRTKQISVEIILSEMSLKQDVPPGLTPHLLKSALNRQASVLSFQNTLLVADAESFVDSGMSMNDRLEAALRKYEEPVSWGIVEQDLARFSYSEHSIYQGLLSETFSLAMGKGFFLHEEKAGLTPEELEILLAELKRILPANGMPLCAAAALEMLTSSLPGRKLSKHPHAPRILWALAKNNTNLIAGTGNLLARPTRYNSDNLFREAILDGIEVLGLARPREVRDWLVENIGFRDQRYGVGVAMNSLKNQGALYRLPNSAYFLAPEPGEDLFEVFAARPALLQVGVLALQPGDLPAKILSELIEFFREFGTIPEVEVHLEGLLVQDHSDFE